MGQGKALKGWEFGSGSVVVCPDVRDNIVSPHRDKCAFMELVVDGVVSRSGESVHSTSVHSAMRDVNVSLLSPGIDTSKFNPLKCIPVPSDVVCVKWNKK